MGLKLFTLELPEIRSLINNNAFRAAGCVRIIIDKYSLSPQDTTPITEMGMAVNGKMVETQVSLRSQATRHVSSGECKTGRLLTCWEAASETLSGLSLSALVLNRVVIPRCLAVIRSDLDRKAEQRRRWRLIRPGIHTDNEKVGADERERESGSGTCRLEKVTLRGCICINSLEELRSR